MNVPWGTRLGVGYVLAVLGFTLLHALAGFGLPGFREVLASQAGSRYSGFFDGLAVLGLAVLGYAYWRAAPTARQWWMILAVAAWLGSSAVSLELHGVLSDSRFWSVTAIGCGLAASAALIPRSTLVRTMVWLGWLYGWGSLAVGVSNLLFGRPLVLVSEERFTRWVSLLGFDVDAFGALNGVTPGRVYVGLTCGLLLVFTARAVRPTRWMWLMWAGLVVAPLWALSRTGGVIIVLGLGAALLAWERWPVWWLLAAVWAVILVPLSLSAWLGQQSISDGTTAWRFDLWQDYLTRPGMWSPFGIGPQPFSLDYADHAHHQLLEAQATGGWLATLGLVGFVVLATLAAWRAARWDRRATIAVLFGTAAIFQVDVVTFTNRYDTINNALVLVLVLLVAGAGREPAASPPHPRLLSESGHAVDR